MAEVESAATVRVAYLVSQYPAPSHVFIEREIQGLRSLGAEVETFSIRSTPDDLLLSDVMRAESQATTVLLDDRRALVGAASALLRSQPRAVGRVLRRALATGEPYVRSRTWQVFYLAEAVRLHAEMARKGLRRIHVHFSNNGADVARLVVALGIAIDGPDSGWSWTMTVHGPTEFEAVERVDLAAKVTSASAVACISDFTRSQLMRLVAPDDWPKLTIVRMSVDTGAYVPPAVPRGHAGPIRILSVGRLVPEKGAPVLVDAVAALSAQGVDVEVRLVGAGPLEHEIRARVERAGLTGRFDVMGPVGQERLPALYHWADIFCLPSFQEGLPVVLMEAMASGLPVVTTRIAGIPELVDDGRNGRVVSPGRADLVAQAVRELTDDLELRERFGEAGRQDIVREFSLDVTAASQLAFLRGAR